MATYNLSKSSSTVNEGDVVTFTLITTGVSDNTSVPYTISGIQSPDINNVLLTGNFTVRSSTAIIGFNVTADMMIEGVEAFVLELVNGLASETVTVYDTSIPPRHFYIKDRNEYQDIEKVYYKNSGIWYPIRKIYTKSSGVWKKVFDKETWSIMVSLVGTEELTDTWNAQATATLTMTFTSVNEAKYFFSSGGKLKFTSRLENGSPTMQNSEWTNLLLAAGSQEFTGYWKDEFNYYKLTDVYQTVYTYIASAPYTSNYYKIEAKCNLIDNTLGGATEVMFRFIWRDDYSRNYIGWNNYIYTESGIDGTLSITVEEIKGVAPSTEPIVISPSYVLSSISYENIVAPVVTYSVVPRVTSINEGQSITFDITNANYGSGTMYYTVVSGVNDVSPVRGPITITNNIGTFTVVVAADLITEGAETFYVQIRRNEHETAVAATSASVTINDTSLSLATFSITPQTLLVNEGSSIVFDVATTYYLPTTLYYTTTGVAVSDVSPTSGTIALVSGAATVAVTASADVTTEGTETFRIQLRTGSTSGPIVATSTSVTITDTSVTPPPTYEIVPNRYGGNETGTGVSFTILTSNVPTGTTLYYTIAGSYSLTASDFTDSALTGSFTIIDNYGSIYKAHTTDAITEGVEVYYIQVRTGSTVGTVVATSSTVIIEDTSTATYAFTVNHTGCTTGNAYAGRGQPGDYNVDTYGQVIWPVSGNNNWVGVVVLPSTSTITVKTTCDNAFNLYHNQGNYIGSGNNWGVWYTFTINVTPYVPNYISFYCQDFGGLYGISCRITDANGEILSLSNTSWVSS